VIKLNAGFFLLAGSHLKKEINMKKILDKLLMILAFMKLVSKAMKEVSEIIDRLIESIEVWIFGQSSTT